MENGKLKEQILNHKILSKKSGVIVELDKSYSTEQYLDYIAKELSDGVGIIELSANGVGDKIFLETAQKTKQLCEMFGRTLIIRERADIAYLSSADSVNLNQESLDTGSVGKILEENSLIGREISINSDESDLVKLDADYITTTIYPASTQPVLETGIEYAKWVSEKTLLPVLIREIRYETENNLGTQYDLFVKLAEK